MAMDHTASPMDQILSDLNDMGDVEKILQLSFSAGFTGTLLHMGNPVLEIYFFINSDKAIG